ncbi:hypothetical protein [Nocardioides sp.]|uniref:hypothetical protein n=1 Tax=Nocardioides sp. TaxID=35761 RepID=UPI0027280884|nr:hypothetical protein [Nocardioides sp.]MDO9458239.1 hypothetical protein [Nocardioides sp.]
MTALTAALAADQAGGDLSAHGIGGQQDLPISLGLAVAGAVAALVVSFTVLAIAWRKPRYDAATNGRPAPELVARVVDHPAFGIALRVFGMVLFLYTAVVAVFGVDKVINPFFGIIYVWLWVGIVPMSLLFGPFWKAISPVRTINLLFARLAGSNPDEGLYAYSARVGYWPAAFGLLAFVWLELVYPYSTELSPVRLWFAVYVAAMLVGGALFGSTFYERADPFEVYSSLVGKASIWARRDGRLLVRSPLANLASIEPVAGLLGVAGVLFGSTGFDSFGESPPYVKFLQGTDVSGYLLNNITLVVFCLGAMGVFTLGCVLTGVGPDQQRRDLPNAFAHSIVPIVIGYVFAHYLSYFVEVGSRTLVLASDPFSNGSDYLGTGDMRDVTWLAYHPTLLASIKVGAVVLGHVVAAIVAHDRALRLLPARHQLTGQLPLLAAMVGFTSGGLFLLFSS